MTTRLPDDAPGRLKEAVASLSPERREALLPHLFGGTSADYLSDWLTRAGAPVSATTIKVFRQRLKRSASE